MHGSLAPGGLAVPDLSVVRRHLDQVVKLARVAAPSAHATDNEREMATASIIRAAEAAGVALGAPPPNAAPAPGPESLETAWGRLTGLALPSGGARTMDRFAQQLSRDDILDAMAILAERVEGEYVEEGREFGYFCGICKRKIAERE